MALRTTPTIAICLTAGIAAGIALARPGDDASTSSARAEPTGYEIDDTSDSVTAGGALAAEVAIEGFAFGGDLAVGPGNAVEVVNLDGAPHTLTADDGSFDTGTLARGESAEITVPNTAGTYSFFCAIHPSMTATFTVG